MESIKSIKKGVMRFIEFPGAIATVIVITLMFISFMIKFRVKNEYEVNKLQDSFMDSIKGNKGNVMMILYCAVLVPFTVLFWAFVIIKLIALD